MSNHSYIKSDKINNIDLWHHFTHGIQKIMQEQTYLILGSEEDNCITISGELEGSMYNETHFFLNEEGWIEWKHHDENWWFTETLAAKAARSIEEKAGGEVWIEDDAFGDNERLKPEFDIKYPKETDWQKSKRGSLGDVIGWLFKP